LDVDAALLAYCSNPSIARRYRALFDDDGLVPAPADLHPRRYGPWSWIVDVARAGPALAVLSAICHGDHPEVHTAFPALTQAPCVQPARRGTGPRGISPESLAKSAVAIALSAAPSEAFPTATESVG
jgi:hypothetical protein